MLPMSSNFVYNRAAAARASSLSRTRGYDTMGCTASDSGISLQFCNKDGSPDGHPIYGRYAVLFGLEQEKLLCEKGSTPDEQRFKGSDDWLTIIAVADSPEKLQDIIDHTPPAVCVPAHTSGSSHRACIELHIGAIRKTF